MYLTVKQQVKHLSKEDYLAHKRIMSYSQESC